MTVLPIVERELRVGARSPLLYRSRYMVPLVGAIVFLFMAYSLYQGAPSQMMGKTMLYVCFGGLFFVCLFAGVQTTADSISREKREGTLGFLFLTDLKGYDIVLGKLVSSSIGGVYSLLGILPVVSVIFLMGGVDGWTVLRLVLSCGNVLFLSLSAGLLASVLCVQERQAKGLASGLIMGLLAGGPLIGLVWFWANGSLDSATQAQWAPFLATSPLMTFMSSISPMRMGGTTAFLIMNGLVQIYGWVFLGLACWLVPRRWQEKGEKPEAKWLGRKTAPAEGRASEVRAQARAKKLDNNPIYWLTSRDRWAGQMVWGYWWLVVLGIAVFVWQADALNLWTGVALVLILNSAMKLSLAGEACKWLSEDRQTGALELILTTTLKEEEILEGQLISLRKRFLLPFLAAAGVQIGFFILCCYTTKVDDGAFSAFMFFLLLTLGMLAVDYHALCWVGMWKGLSAMPPGKARQQTVSAVLTMPWVLFYVGLIPISCVTGGAGFVLLWPAVMFGVPGWWNARAKSRLREEFRTRAMERYSPAPKLPFWKRMGQLVNDMVVPDKKPAR
jgi:ABC-type transport system involved in multi-copper enzyme maturation permease subunit